MSWYNASWDYRVKITVDKDQVDSNLTDFPVYVDLSDLPAGFHTNVNQTDARDIRVTRSDGITECPREVVSYDSSTDTGELHFKANSLSSSSDTDFYIYYGNSGASEPASDATYGAENVYDSDFVGVYHLKDNTTSSVLDSTSVDNDGTKESTNSPIEANGKIGKGQDFTATDDYIEIGTTDFSATYGTITLWFNLESYTTDDRYRFFGHTYPTNSWGSRIFIGVDYGTNEFYIGLGDAWDKDTNIFTPSIETWYKVTLVWNDGDYIVYKDGSQISSGTYSSLSTIASIADIGNTVNTSSRNYAPNGLIDEVKISKSARSSDWISAEYTNQNTPTTFYTVGSQETGSTDTNSEIPAKTTGSQTSNDEFSGFLAGGHGRYVEDFSTTDKKDGATTASWTGDGSAEMETT